jgi:hypothetical protein
VSLNTANKAENAHETQVDRDQREEIERQDEHQVDQRERVRA